MGELRRFRKKAGTAVTAVQVDLDTKGFSYRKWGDTQFCKRGDWLVNNQGDVYTIDGETFEATYRPAGAGVYVKLTPVWAEAVEEAGVIETKEGATHYEVGDYLVYNDRDRKDGYAVSAAKFEEMYEPASKQEGPR
ncbi:MAG: hypothetical protein GY769_18625 [bacterium]|nr:hypothetical protein [bacterium]